MGVLLTRHVRSYKEVMSFCIEQDRIGAGNVHSGALRAYPETRVMGVVLDVNDIWSLFFSTIIMLFVVWFLAICLMTRAITETSQIGSNCDFWQVIENPALLPGH